jgi:uncharacterized membrane protein YdjX (TVP38/TMEM64 family)
MKGDVVSLDDVERENKHINAPSLTLLKRRLVALALVIGGLLVIFIIVGAMNVPFFNDPSPWMFRESWAAKTLGLWLLVFDIVLPVPSSLLMVAHGAMFGILWGTLLSVLGGLGAALLGFAIGRRGMHLVDSSFSSSEREWVNNLITRWGIAAIIVTRPVPLLAESVVIIAGTMPNMTWRKLAMASTVGLLPTALLYAVAGHTANSFSNTALIFLLGLGIAGVFWFASHYWDRYRQRARKQTG